MSCLPSCFVSPLYLPSISTLWCCRDLGEGLFFYFGVSDISMSLLDILEDKFAGVFLRWLFALDLWLSVLIWVCSLHWQEDCCFKSLRMFSYVPYIVFWGWNLWLLCSSHNPSLGWHSWPELTMSTQMYLRLPIGVHVGSRRQLPDLLVGWFITCRALTLRPLKCTLLLSLAYVMIISRCVSFSTIEVKLAAFKSLLNSHVYHELPISWAGFGVEDIATKLRTVSVCITSSIWTAN